MNAPNEAIAESGWSQWMTRLGANPRLAFFAALFTMVGAGLSIGSVVMAMRSIDDAKTQMTVLTEISARTSTQYVNDFPFNLRDIVATLQDANTCVLIATDVIGYGIFSNRAEYEEYEKTLSALHRKRVPIELASHSVERKINERRLIYKSTFDRVGFGEDRVKDLESRYRPAGIQSWSDFEEALTTAEDDARKRIVPLTNSSFVETSSDMPLFIWIVDEKSAVFSVPTYQGTVKETTFKTNDARLITQLKNVFCSYSPKAPACTGKCT